MIIIKALNAIHSGFSLLGLYLESQADIFYPLKVFARIEVFTLGTTKMGGNWGRALGKDDRRKHASRSVSRV
jgi:hypothetical protein